MGRHRAGQDARVLRNRTNQISGWLGWVLLTVVWCLSDPMGFVYLGEDPWATRSFGTLVTAVIGLGSFLFVLLFAVPYVRLAPGGITVQNFLTRWVIPQAQVAGVEQGTTYPRVTLHDGRRVCLYAAERSRWMDLRGLSVVTDQDLVQPGVEAGTGEGAVARRWVMPGELKIVGAFWVLLLLGGSLFGSFSSYLR